MKKQHLYLLFFFAFLSCQEDIKFNSPAFQGQKDNVFWRAIDTKASLAANGSLSIEAYTRDEKITLKTASIFPGTYSLGISDSNTATYSIKNTDKTVSFSTGINIGDGEIVIEEYDTEDKTITGKFKFNAVNTNTNLSEESILNFQYGIFYKIPVSTNITTNL